MTRLHLLLSVAWVWGCGNDGPDGPPTYNQDIAPIIEQRCLACHQIGRVAPFSLSDWSQVQPRVSLIASAVATRKMPPLPAAQDADCPQINDPRVMPDEERDLIARWAAAGAPEGDPPAKEGSSSLFGALGAPTDRYPMPTSYTSTFDFTDDYRCFLIDPKITSTIAVSAVSVEPNNRSIMHHAAVFAVPPAEVPNIQTLDNNDPGPGYTCFSGAGVVQAYPVGLWVPGYDSPPSPPRPTIGFYLPAGWQLVLQNHYNFTNGRGSDQSAVTLWRAQTFVTEIPHSLYLSDTTFFIPAGATSTMRSMSGDVLALGSTPALGQVTQGWIYSSWAHMHLLGKSINMDLVHSDGSSKCLLHIPAWDFHWQSAYQFTHPVYAAPGDKVRLTCEWDNSATNQPAIGGTPLPPHDVTYGEKTTDEMCIGTLALLDYPF